MSIGFLLNNDSEAVVWRGPKKSAMIKQFLTDVCWRDRDVLIIDTPPGSFKIGISSSGLRSNNVCSIKFRSKHSTNTILCLLRNLMEQALCMYVS